MKKIISLVLSAALSLSLAACAGEVETPSQGATTQPETTAPIRVNQFTETGMLASGQSVELTADTLSGDIQWSSSNPELATVDETGKVTALSNRGTVTITAQSGTQSQQWQIPLCQQTAFGNVSLSNCEESLTIGVWPGPFQWFDDATMKLMQDAGINLIVGIKDQWLWEGDGAPMLDLAEQYGVSVLSDFRTWDGETVPEYAEHSALKGFLFYDEPSVPHFWGLAELKEKFDALMPEDKLFFVNLFPESCSYESLFGEDYHPGQVDYEQYYLNSFMDTVSTECLSYDGYPLQEGGTIRSTYYHNFDAAAKRAKEDGVPFWYTLNASGHSTTDGRYVTPTEKELRWQMLMGMTYGSNTLSHYILTSADENDDNMLQYMSWEPTAIYDCVKTVNHEMLAWDDIYMNYQWVGTAAFDAAATKGFKHAMLESLEYDLSFEETGVLTGVQSDESLLIGMFQNGSENAYLVTNAGMVTPCEKYRQYSIEMKDATVTLQLAEGNYRCAAVINRGNIQYVPVNADNTVNITVPAFDGVFVIPVI